MNREREIVTSSRSETPRRGRQRRGEIGDFMLDYDSFNHGADEGEERERERDVTDLRSARERSYS